MSSKINLQTCEYARKSSIFQDNQLISLKNIPFEGVITEADSGKIVVKGDGTNGCGLTEHYQIYNSDQIKIVNTNDELIQFTDLKKGTRISMRLWIKEKTLYNDMDRLDIVTLIQCCE